MEDLAFRRIVPVAALPTASATYKGVFAYKSSDDTLHWCDGSSWIEVSPAKLQALANLTWAANKLLRLTGAGTLEAIDQVDTVAIAASDETTDLETGTEKATFRMPYAMTLTEVRASLTTAPTGSTVIVDINEGGASILSTKLSIDASEKTSKTAASAAVISGTSLADDAEITVDIDQVGSATAGAGLKVWLIGRRT